MVVIPWARQRPLIRALPLSILVAALLTLLGAVAIVSTYDQLSHTYDEPTHIAAGLELLDHGVYRVHRESPPLARVASALLPYLDGVRSPGSGDIKIDRATLISSLPDYDRFAYLSRLGMLPFFLLLAGATWLWARHLTSAPAATAALFLLVTTVPLVGHAGLATTDVASIATIVTAFLLGTLWIDRPSPGRAAAFGVAVGLALGTKYSAIAFLGISFATWIVARALLDPSARPIVPLRRGHLPILALAFLAAFTVVFGFDFRPLRDPSQAPFEAIDRTLGDSGWLHDVAYWLVQTVPVPPAIPAFARGMSDLSQHNALGHWGYFMGEVSRDGWWYFYPVMLLVRTPIPLLLLGIGGLAWLAGAGIASRNWRQLAPGFAALGLLVFLCGFSKINIGLRHAMVLYPLLAVGGGYAVRRLARWNWPARAAVGLLLAWQATSLIAAHPDQMAYFNMLAGDAPERIAVDSDLDWGQDLHRLAAFVDACGIDDIAVDYFGTQDPSRLVPQSRDLEPEQPTTGWIAVSIRQLVGWNPPRHTWLQEHTPYRELGRSIRIYYIGDKAAAEACDRQR